MDDNGIVKRIEEDLGKLLNIKVAGRIFPLEDITVFVVKIDAPPYICIIDHFDFSIVKEAILNEAEWSSLLQWLHKIILDRSFGLILDDLKKITGAAKFYETNCLKYFKPPADYKTANMDIDVLDAIGVQTFVYRLGGQCITIQELAALGIDRFMTLESSIGILLRSCVLDCLYIMAWCNDDKLISAIASESFLRPQGKDVPDQVKNHFQDVAKFFNPDNLDAIDAMRIKNILKTLEGKPNIQWYENLYSFYSKYDHFSLIPHIVYKSPVEKMEMILMATHMIKYSLCALLTMRNNNHSDKFQEILGVKNVSEDGKNFSFVY
ncbi:hypothetical protein DYBT9623_05154 [Dyadobacter sp. CECT 9623]|uniref:Uncharacterized protein n=1 Tax=Dyadobacter linearis TaxID=2823330 RepID=A0ABN7RJQ3_9BACT|nr:hypothetical protein [Dyadobacter sp. CECT 9623]CAG5074467.1 hypothetical protein DYBT9623_05154 [Dyadobacter sp. CECT 9623]